MQLLEGEEIILTVRKHWFVIAVEGGFLLLMGIMPFFALAAFGIISPEIMPLLLDYWEFIFFYATAWLLFSWMIFYITWTNYYLDTLLITNKRIIDIEQFGLFARDFAELRLENVQDIKVEILGLIPSLLKMGDLHIQTAGQIKEIVFRSVADPYKIKNIISMYHDQTLKEK